MKKSLILVSCAVLMASCNFRHIVPEDEFDVVDKLIVDFDVDWSELDEKPTGLTLCFYPTGDAVTDTKNYIFHYNTVDHVQVKLPEQDYSLICFNQSETEFANYEFDLSSYETACVRVKTDAEATQTHVRYTSATRADTTSAVLTPNGLAVASMNSVVKGSKTRALNLMGVLKPTNVVKSMTLKIYVFGLNERVEVSGSISNLCDGVTMCTREPLPEPVEQKLNPELWDMVAPPLEDLPGSINATIGIFGPFEGFDEEFSSTPFDATRAGEPSVRQILNLLFKMPDMTEHRCAIDITDLIRAQYLNGINDIVIEIGSAGDNSSTNHENEDGQTAGGCIVIHNTDAASGYSVSVAGWDSIRNEYVTF